MAALVEASASSPQGSSPQGTILWSELVREFNAAYDVVFDNMGRKAYFDFNRVNPPPPPGSNYIDVCILKITLNLSSATMQVTF